MFLMVADFSIHENEFFFIPPPRLLSAAALEMSAPTVFQRRRRQFFFGVFKKYLKEIKMGFALGFR